MLIDKPYEEQYYNAVRQWIINHYDLLIQFWNQDIDEFELKDALTKNGGN